METSHAAYPPVAIFGSEARTLTSAAGIEYEISVLPPLIYATERKPCPVVYILDGNYGFALGAATTLSLSLGQHVPDLILVGIGYHLSSLDDWQPNRDRDYNPVPRPDHPDDRGGVPQFLEFIETRLFPFIESNYPADPKDRTLVGYSLGANLAIYALLTRPALFNRYIAASPAMAPAALALFTAALDAPRDQPASPVRLAMPVGELDEGRENTETFWKRLRQRNFEELALTTVILNGETHASVPARAYVDGLKAVFAS